MALFVVLFGFLITALGVVGLAAPRWVIGSVLNWQARTRFVLAVGLRFAFGVALLLGVSTFRFPRVARALALVVLVTALVLALLGQRRADSIAQWWFRRPVPLLRAWFAAALLFGGFLLYGGL